MNRDDIILLTKMKRLIKLGRRRFLIRKDRDYISDLLELGISEEEAWNEHILFLNSNYYFVDSLPFYLCKNNVLIFKKDINGIKAYIKLKLETNGEESAVCVSFHKDYKGVNNEM